MATFSSGRSICCRRQVQCTLNSPGEGKLRALGRGPALTRPMGLKRETKTRMMTCLAALDFKDAENPKLTHVADRGDVCTIRVYCITGYTYAGTGRQLQALQRRLVLHGLRVYSLNAA